MFMFISFLVTSFAENVPTSFYQNTLSKNNTVLKFLCARDCRSSDYRQLSLYPSLTGFHPYGISLSWNSFALGIVVQVTIVSFHFIPRFPDFIRSEFRLFVFLGRVTNPLPGWRRLKVGWAYLPNEDKQKGTNEI